MGARRVHSVSYFRGAWMEAQGARVTVAHDGRRAGVRTILHLWIDQADERNGAHPAGTVTRRVVSGDGRTSAFEVLEAEEVVSPLEALTALREAEQSLTLDYGDARADGDLLWIKRARERYMHALRVRSQFEGALAVTA